MSLKSQMPIHERPFYDRQGIVITSQPEPAKSGESSLPRGGDRTKSGMETPPIIDISNRQISATLRFRRNELHGGYTELP